MATTRARDAARESQSPPKGRATNIAPGRRTHSPSSSPGSASPPHLSNIAARPALSVARGSAPRTSSTLSSTTPMAAAIRRQSLKASVAIPSPSGLESPAALVAALNHEIEQKELLMVQCQDKDTQITTLSNETSNITSALNAAETRLHEMYTDQARAEEEMATRIEVAEKLRAQVRELERDKRDLQRRYNEQTGTFEAERQGYYDNEQHLKSRIQTLMRARKPQELETVVAETRSQDEDDEEEDQEVNPELNVNLTVISEVPKESVEMASLRTELSTLSTSYTSMQNAMALLQTQLLDLQRVNNQLQEENESYMILLRERTLSGQFNVMRQVGSTSIVEEDETEGDDLSIDQRSMHSSTRSILDRVEEEDSELDPEVAHIHAHESDHPSSNGEEEDPDAIERRQRRGVPHHRRGPSYTGVRGGESLAGLPITGPGLDLAAELGRATSKDGLPDFDENEKLAQRALGKRSKKGFNELRSDVDYNQLKNEVKNLKDANKALSLYASKIIDRIISQEGFEHVLAVDFDKQPTPTANQSSFPLPSSSKNPMISGPEPPTVSTKSRARPQSMMFPTSSAPGSFADPVRPKAERLTTFSSISPASPISLKPESNKKSNRRSFSLDWSSFSIFNADPKKSESPNLRPLTLKPGTLAVTGPNSTARKLETQEDEDDRKERERLHATMKLMGIELPVSSPPQPPSPIPDFISPTLPKSPATATTPTAPIPSRFSFFRSKTSNSVPTAADAGISTSRSLTDLDASGGLTTAAVAQATAENSLAALDAHEVILSADMARGSGGGFTDVPRRGASDRRSKRSGRISGSGPESSGSTVFSAGNDEDE